MTPEERSAWLEERRKSLGASDVPAVLGLSPWRSPYAIWASKVHGVDTRAGEPADIGQWLEAPIFEMWRAKLAERDLRLGPGAAVEYTSPGLLRSEAYPWAHATPDYLAWASGVPYVLQIKSVGSLQGARKWDRAGGIDFSETPSAWPDTDEDGTVPAAYYLQTLWEMWVTEQATGVRPAFGLLIALVPDGGLRLRSYRVDFDDDLVAGMVDFCGAWWARHVAGGAVPDVGASDGEPLALLNPIVRGVVELDDPAAARAITGYQDARRRARYASDAADTHKHTIVELLGAARGGIVEMPDGERLLVSQVRREGKGGPYTTISIKPAGNRRPTADLSDAFSDWSPIP